MTDRSHAYKVALRAEELRLDPRSAASLEILADEGHSELRMLLEESARKSRQAEIVLAWLVDQRPEPAEFLGHVDDDPALERLITKALAEQRAIKDAFRPLYEQAAVVAAAIIARAPAAALADTGIS